MSRLLIHEPPVQFLQSLAVEIGLDKAIILQQMHYWLHNYSISEYRASVPWINRIHYHCCEHFLMWDNHMVCGIVDSLIKTGHIITRNFKEKEELFTINYEHMERENE